jgi:hypothetical protein
MTYQFMRNEISSQHLEGTPTSVIVLPMNSMNKLHEGPPPVLPQTKSILFWDYISKWDRTWMWEDINATQRTKEDTTWIAKGMQEETLIWTTDGSYDRKRAVDLLGVSWIIFCKWTGLHLKGMFWERLPTASPF